MKKIRLATGEDVLVDDGDYEALIQSGYTWSRMRGNAIGSRTYYAQGYKRGSGFLMMHHFIMNPPDGLSVDHINHDGLDNRRENLRLSNQAFQNANRRKPKSNTSGYKGVWKERDKWRAAIGVDGKSIKLGTFASKVDAALAYDAAATKYYGEFACLNFPPRKTPEPEKPKEVRRMNKIAFTGHRDRVCNPETLKNIANQYPGAIWIHGGAEGFDTQVENFALKNGIKTEVIRPDYAKYSEHPKQAPIERNKRIVNSGDLLIALYDGRETGGTAFIIGYARRMRKPVLIIKPLGGNNG